MKQCKNCGCTKFDEQYHARTRSTFRSFHCGMDEKQHDGDPESEIITPCSVDTTYGLCPLCGARGDHRERRPDGDDTCVNGHTYPSAHAIKVEGKDDQAVSSNMKRHKIEFVDDRLYMFKNGKLKKQMCMFAGDRSTCGLQCPHCVLEEGLLKLCHGTRHYVEAINEPKQG